MSSDDDTTEPTELDPGMVEKARAAFEAMNVAQQERDRLRADAVEVARALLDERGQVAAEPAAHRILDGPGEQPGEIDGYCTCHDDQKGCTRDCGVKAHREAGRPAPVVPDSPDVYETIRAFIEEEVGFDGGPGMDDQARRLTDRVLAVVGQGVTAEQAWDEGLRAGEAVERARWQWSAGATARAVNGLTERPERPSNPYRAAVRPTGQEQVDG